MPGQKHKHATDNVRSGRNTCGNYVNTNAFGEQRIFPHIVRICVYIWHTFPIDVRMCF